MREKLTKKKKKKKKKKRKKKKKKREKQKKGKKNQKKKKKKKQPCLRHLEKALQASKDDDDTPVVRVVGDRTMKTKVSGVESRTVLRSPQELAIENA